MPATSLASPVRAGLGLALLALVAGAVAMGVSPILVRLARAADVGPFASAFWRAFLALPLLWLWMRFEERGAAGPPVRASRLGLLAGLAFTGDLFFWHLSILGTSVANATFFATTTPVFVVLVGWLAFGRRVEGHVLAGLALCLVGGAALMGQSLRVDPDRLTGDLYGIATALFFALYFLAVGAARGRGAGAARITFEMSLVVAPLLLVAALVAGDGLLPSTMGGWGALVAMAWVSQVGGQGLLALALGRLPAVFSSLVIFIEAVAAALLGWLVLGEGLDAVQAAGGAAILAGIWHARPRRGEP